MSYAAFTLNRTAKSSVEGKTPYKVFYKKPPFDIKLLHKFGQSCIVHIPAPKRKSFDPRGQDGIFIGYPNDTKGFKVKLKKDNKIVESRNVVFYNEPKPKEKAPPEHVNLDATEPGVTDKDSVNNDENDVETEVIEMDLDWDSDNEDKLEYKTLVCIPKTFNEIEQNPNKEIWEKAVQKELESMNWYSVWKEIPDMGQETVGSKWVFKEKETPIGIIGKARLVALRYEVEKEKEGDTYSPVAAISAIRVFLSVVLNRKWTIKQLDVETAFLNSNMEEEIYLKPPKGYKCKSGYVLRVLKLLYGFRKSPKSWFTLLCKVLIELRFV